MKQGSLVVEFVNIGDSVLYIVRAINGRIIRVCEDLLALNIFFDETEQKVMSNSNSNQDGKA